jgi:hypothetical protein
MHRLDDGVEPPRGSAQHFFRIVRDATAEYARRDMAVPHSAIQAASSRLRCCPALREQVGEAPRSPWELELALAAREDQPVACTGASSARAPRVASPKAMDAVLSGWRHHHGSRVLSPHRAAMRIEGHRLPRETYVDPSSIRVPAAGPLGTRRNKTRGRRPCTSSIFTGGCLCLAFTDTSARPPETFQFEGHAGGSGPPRAASVG